MIILFLPAALKISMESRNRVLPIPPILFAWRMYKAVISQSDFYLLEIAMAREEIDALKANLGADIQ